MKLIQIKSLPTIMAQTLVLTDSPNDIGQIHHGSVETTMSSSHGFSRTETLYAELLNFAVAALASGTHSDHALLLLHKRYRESENGEALQRKLLLRSLISTPAQTPLGVAVKLTVACRLDGYLDAAQEASEGPVGSHIIVSALIDSLAQAQLLPKNRSDPRH